MKLFSDFFKKLHVCSYGKPLVSKYISFHTRDIIYECSCGKRRVERIYKDFGSPFPIEINSFITNKEFEEILNAGKK